MNQNNEQRAAFTGHYVIGTYSKIGDLILTPTPEGVEAAKEYIAQNRHQPHDRGMWEMLEDWCCNGWMRVEPEWIGALTAAPILTEDGWIADNGDFTMGEDGHVYGHMRYAVEDVVETWTTGKPVRFDRGD